MGKEESLGGVPARMAPASLWSVVELGSHVLGKAQPPSVDLWPQDHDQITSCTAHSSSVSTSLTLAGARWNALSAPRGRARPSTSSLSLVPDGDAR